MKVQEIMNSHTRQISSSAMLREAADRMRDLDTDVLPVVENRRIVGTISRQEVAIRMDAREIDPGTTPVRSVMTPGATCCSEDDDIEQAAAVMKANHARRLIVLDPCGQAVGVVSAEDLAATADERSHTGSLMEGENHESPRY